MASVVQYANIVIKFGDQNLLDDFEIVSRAFLDDVRVRGRGRTKYHFLEPKLATLRDNDPMSLAFHGRIVKDTILERDQVMDSGQLKQNHREMRSSPSAYFVLMLATHRLVFLPETRFAPSLNEFASTTRRFILDAHDEVVRRRHKEEKLLNPKLTLKAIRAANPQPTLTLVPLKSDEGIVEFLSRFDLIKKVKVTMIDRNHEFDPQSTLENFQNNMLAPTQAKRATLVLNATEEGLNQEGTSELIKNVTDYENDEVEIDGLDSNGNTLRGSNDSFKLQRQIDDDFGDDAALASGMADSYDDLVNNGTVRDVLDTEEKRQSIRSKLMSVLGSYL